MSETQGQAAPAQARYRLVTVAVSYGCEMIRWSLQRAALPFDEERHVPLFHAFRTLLLGAGKEVPIVITKTVVWQTLPGILYAIDARASPGCSVFGDRLEDRQAAEVLIQELLADLAVAIRQHLYGILLEHRAVLEPMLVVGAPTWERVLLKLAWPLWKMAIRKGMGIAPDTLASAPARIAAGLQVIETALVSKGTPFLAGEQPGGIDVVAASLLAPLVLPPEFGGAAVRLDQMPEDLQNFLRAIQKRPAGRYALTVYREARHART